MFRDILVPVDLSQKNAAAVQTAARLAKAEGGTVRLLHVVETLQDVSFEEAEDFYRGLERRAEEVLGEWGKELEQLEVESRADIRFGRRGREIIRFASEEPCDLIVLTSHQLDPEVPGGRLGTLSHQVAIAAPCPVLLVR